MVPEEITVNLAKRQAVFGKCENASVKLDITPKSNRQQTRPVYANAKAVIPFSSTNFRRNTWRGETLEWPGLFLNHVPDHLHFMNTSWCPHYRDVTNKIVEA